MTWMEFLDLICTGAALGALVRWVFQLDIQLGWAVALGILALLLQPWFEASVLSSLGKMNVRAALGAGGLVAGTAGAARFRRPWS